MTTRDDWSELRLTLGPRVARGSIAEVWRARDGEGRRCALKILREDMRGDREAAERLRMEARIAAHLDHPSLLGTLAAGTTADARPFLLTPWLEGETLRQRVARGRLSRDRTLALFAEALFGVHAAHEGGVLHRDLKPSNLFLETDAGDRVRILDFGIARWMNADLHPTADGYVVGTPRYMAPEQILGGPLTRAADVYAMGLSLWEALLGRHPFEGLPSGDTLRAQLAIPASALPMPSGIEPELARVLRASVAKSPHERPQTARALAQALFPFVGNFHTTPVRRAA